VVGGKVGRPGKLSTVEGLGWGRREKVRRRRRRRSKKRIRIRQVVNLKGTLNQIVDPSQRGSGREKVRRCRGRFAIDEGLIGASVEG